jgi:hypothetical protein
LSSLLSLSLRTFSSFFEKKSSKAKNKSNPASLFLSLSLSHLAHSFSFFTPQPNNPTLDFQHPNTAIPSLFLSDMTRPALGFDQTASLCVSPWLLPLSLLESKDKSFKPPLPKQSS